MSSAGQGSQCQTPAVVLMGLVAEGQSMHFFAGSRPPSPSRSTSPKFSGQVHSSVTEL